MKKLFIAITSVLCIAMLSTACTTSERKDTGMVIGGVAGGVAGSALTGGSTVGTIVGAVGGGYIGRKVAN